jgi:hypothetical protein
MLPHAFGLGEVVLEFSDLALGVFEWQQLLLATSRVLLVADCSP